VKTVCTIEARMSSSRLPGKVLLPARDKPMLAHLVERLRRAPSIDAIVLATTLNRTDDVLVEFAHEHGMLHYRGSEHDVMARVIGAAEQAQADVVVEITADCPIVDPGIVEQVIRMFRHNPCDYASNAHVRSYPDGMDVQVFALAALRRSAAMTADPLEREHVTLHMRRHPELFRQVHLVAPPQEHWPELGLTLDEQADYALLKTLIEHFGEANPFFTCREAIAALRAHPHWLELNRDVPRKGAA
jgi:spore coat polysaccharide biosynthesis protein SpsF